MEHCCALCALCTVNHHPPDSFAQLYCSDLYTHCRTVNCTCSREHPTKTWACATHKQFTMQAVAVAWVRGKCEEAMREVLGAGRGVQAGEVETPAMAAEARRETRQGAERGEEGDGGDGAHDSERVSRVLSRKALSFAPCSLLSPLTHQ